MVRVPAHPKAISAGYLREISPRVWLVRETNAEPPRIVAGDIAPDDQYPQFNTLTGCPVRTRPGHADTQERTDITLDPELIWAAYTNAIDARPKEDWRTFVVPHGDEMFTAVWTPHMQYNQNRVHLHPHQFDKKTLDCQVHWKGDAQVTYYQNKPDADNTETYKPYPEDEFTRYRLKTTLANAVRKGMLRAVQPHEQLAFAAKIVADGIPQPLDKDKDDNYLRAIIPYWQANTDFAGLTVGVRTDHMTGYDTTNGKRQLDLYLKDFRELHGREFLPEDATNFDHVARTHVEL